MKVDSSRTKDSGSRLSPPITAAGSESGAPKVSSAGETPESSHGAALRPKGTHGKCAGHWAPARRAFSASFRRRWNRSTKRFDWGWYAVVSTCWIPRRRSVLLHVPEVNCVPPVGGDGGWQAESDFLYYKFDGFLPKEDVHSRSATRAIFLNSSGRLLRTYKKKPFKKLN
jgi:hypothetical protein